MKEVKVGCVTYTYNEDGTVTRTVDADCQAAVLAKLNKDSE